MNRILQEIQDEVMFQRNLGFNDSYNTCGLWVSYIANYATRWALPASFNKDKYTFRTCMIKVAALCVSAILWHETRPTWCPDEDAVQKVNS